MTGSSTRPTLEEVAARAGVGRGTVSRVINGSPRVSEQAREAVHAAIAELGYVPNRAARSLVTRRTDTVALVIAESEQRLFGEPYFAGIIRGISTGLGGTAFQLLLALARSPEEYARLEQYLTLQHVDGVLFTSLHADDPLPARLEAGGVPTVLNGRPPGLTPVSYVDVDNRTGAEEAVGHLLAQGRRRIAAVAGPQDMGAGLDRLNGYRVTLAEAGLPEFVAYGDFSEASGIAAADELLDRHPDLDAIFAASDPMALGALRALRRRGRRVPEDVAVVGFDDSAGAELADPPLTTVHQSPEEIGERMTRLLIARIRGERVDDPVVILRPHLVRRDSA
ncbi:LacI family DNA-binding transcriptional regulator [Actinomadura parmotrematis]|uniref:LacI family transcriptional regulator n=1 Tax=Actinomadura parmotrematis TaxID=2864039 RepID=A0ABS7FPH7_9ACTN|nr:LacI family DNA-binding transcriptional regulator [Actinomadura parmotrematis]MBW8482272.1 LacI family transcriptional regulator [Actinomadura parmotrematis]